MLCILRVESDFDRMSASVNHQGFKKYLSNTSWLFAEKIFRMLIVLLITIWMARYLGPERFGLFSYALSFVALFSVLASLGLEKLLPKELIGHPKKEMEILGTSFFLKIIGSLILLIVAAYVITLLRPDDELILALILIFSVTNFFKSFEIIRYWFETHVQAKYSVAVDAITVTLSVIAKAVLIILQAPLIAFAWVVLAEAVVLALGLVAVYAFKSHKITAWRVDGEQIKHLLKEAWPLILAGGLYTIYTRIDQIMLGDMIGNESVGIYAAAIRISEGWFFIPVVIGTSLYPALLNAKKRDQNLYLERTQHLLNIMVLLGFSAGIVISLIAYPFITFAFGGSYEQSSPVLVIHIGGWIFTAMSAISYRYFITEGLQKTSFYRGLTGLISNIILNYLLIPLYGAIGAAVATVVSQVLALYLFNLTNAKTRPMFYMQTKAILLTDAYNTLKHIKTLRSNR